MAIWQCKFSLIPVQAIRAKFGVVPITVPENLAEDSPWWRDTQPPVGFEKKIDAILREADSWAEGMRIWGDEDSDTASICYDSKSKVEWVGFRVDARKLSTVFVREICELANELECVLLTADYHLISPDEVTVIAAINHSRAKRFVEDPVGTLQSIKRDTGEIIQFPEEEKHTPPKH